MALSKTTNRITLRPPPGSRFTLAAPDKESINVGINGADVILEFAHERSEELVTWLHNWIDTYVVPELHFNRQLVMMTTSEAVTEKQTPESKAQAAAVIQVKENPNRCAFRNSDEVQCDRNAHGTEVGHAVKVKGGYFPLT